MRKNYPYLQEQYIYNLNEEQNKRQFLSQLDNFVNQRQYVLITLLDWQENPIKEIQGEITGGSISKDGASSVRATCNLSCTVDAGTYTVEDLSLDFEIKTKVFIEIGIRNETDQYLDYPILWFPQGVFIITDFSMNSSTTSAVNLNMTLKDKMCLLNGDVGGLLPASVQFDIMDTQISSGEWIQQKVLIYNIILELVNHYGGIDLNNIIIQDVPLYIRQVMKWEGKNPLYGIRNSETEATQWTFFIEDPNDPRQEKFESGMDVGYVYRDFVLTDELTGSAGTPITTILDTLKNKLGNYEYFFNEFGIFIFREIKNYLNITQAEIVEEEISNPGRRIMFGGGKFLLDDNSENQYLIETTNEKTLYSFSDDSNITSITITPQYGNIKNDYIVEGVRQSTSSDVKYTVRYHLAIDDVPEIEGTYNGRDYYGKYDDVIYYTDTTENELKRVNKLGIITRVDSLPNVGNMDMLYCVNGDNCYYWDNTGYKEIFLITDDDYGNEIENPVIPQTYYAYDWRTMLYLQGLQANPNGVDEGNYYFQELAAYWPMEYDLNPNIQRFFSEETNGEIKFDDYSQGNFFLDFIDANSSSLGEYSVNTIGRRQQVTNQEDINCLFIPEIPNVIFLNKDDPTQNWTENTSGYLTDNELDTLYINMLHQTPPKLRETKLLGIQRQECINNTQPWTQVGEDIYSNLSIGGYSNSAYEQIRYELFCHTRYQKTVSITSIPIFYLAPNSRVELNSRSTNTYGDFMVQNVSITLGPGANMSCTLNEVAERL